MDNQVTLQDQLENLKRLNRNRFDYVLARSNTKTSDAALREVGLTKGWLYKFTEEERAELERLADELHYQKKIQAELILADVADEAARVKAAGLRSRKENIQQDVATEILDRTVGKPANKTELSGSVGVNLIWTPHKPA